MLTYFDANREREAKYSISYVRPAGFVVYLDPGVMITARDDRGCVVDGWMPPMRVLFLGGVELPSHGRAGFSLHFAGATRRVPSMATPFMTASSTIGAVSAGRDPATTALYEMSKVYKYGGQKNSPVLRELVRSVYRSLGITHLAWVTYDHAYGNEERTVLDNSRVYGTAYYARFPYRNFYSDLDLCAGISQPLGEYNDAIENAIKDQGEVFSRGSLISLKHRPLLGGPRYIGTVTTYGFGWYGHHDHIYAGSDRFPRLYRRMSEDMNDITEDGCVMLCDGFQKAYSLALSDLLIDATSWTPPKRYRGYLI